MRRVILGVLVLGIGWLSAGEPIPASFTVDRKGLKKTYVITSNSKDLKPRRVSTFTKRVSKYIAQKGDTKLYDKDNKVK